MAIQITTSNIKSFPVQPLGAVRTRILQAAQFPGINFGQELHPGGPRGPMESQMWENIMRRNNKHSYGLDHEVPISLPPWWDVQEARSIKLTNRVGGEYAPDRFMTVVIAIKKKNVPVAFVNMHPEQKPRRDEIHHKLWEQYAKGAVYEIDKLHRKGYHVIFGGDMNMRGIVQPFALIPDAKILVTRGLDHLWALPAHNWAVRTILTRQVGRTQHMDHPILSARIRFARA